GSNRPMEINVRVIAATNRNLEEMMRSGTFREDLYYRLQVIELRVPALRERPEEIAPLVEFFLSKYGRIYRRPALRPSPVLMEAIATHVWPGNIRELETMVKRFVVLQEEGLVLSELARLRQVAAETRPAAVAHPAVAAAAVAVAAPPAIAPPPVAAPETAAS